MTLKPVSLSLIIFHETKLSSKVATNLSFFPNVSPSFELPRGKEKVPKIASG